MTEQEFRKGAKPSGEAVDHPAHYGGDTPYETIKVLRAVPKTHAVICRSNRAPVMNSAASKVMVRDIAGLPS